MHSRVFVTVLASSFACLAMALATAKQPFNPSIGWVVIAFWVLLGFCAWALTQLVDDKDKDEQKKP